MTVTFSHTQRRVARLVGGVWGLVAGVFYVVWPPITTTKFLNSPWPAQAWGVFFLIGGLVSMVAWWRRVLVLDRIGLSFLITGTAALALTQATVMLSYPISYTRGGGTAVLFVLLGYLVGRWQDVRKDEIKAREAIDATEQLED